MIWPFFILLGHKRRPMVAFPCSKSFWIGKKYKLCSRIIFGFFSKFFKIFRKTDLNFSNFSKKYFSKNGQRLLRAGAVCLFVCYNASRRDACICELYWHSITKVSIIIPSTRSALPGLFRTFEDFEFRAAFTDRKNTPTGPSLPWIFFCHFHA
jgi:hypothetical protein